MKNIRRKFNLMINVGVISLEAHIYVYIGPGAQFEDVK